MKRSVLFLFVAMLGVAPLSFGFGQEKEAVFTGLKRPDPEVVQKMYDKVHSRHPGRMKSLVANTAPPLKFDCRDMGWVPPVENQGSCGDCYGVSACDDVTSAHCKAGNQKSDGSFAIRFQYGLDCKSNFGGCGGGWPSEVFEYIKTHGFPAEYYTDASGVKHTDYASYTARPSSCRLSPSAKLWKIDDWGYATGSNSDRGPTKEEFKAAMFQYGQLNVCLDAGGQFGSGTGTITQLGLGINHAISAVAYDEEKGVLLRNNWGEPWGIDGYRWLAWSQVSRLRDVVWVSVAGVTPPVPPVPPIPPVPPTPGELVVSGLAVKVFTVVEKPSEEKPLVVTAPPGAKLYFWQDNVPGNSSSISPSNVRTYKTAPVGKLVVECTAIDAAFNVVEYTKTVTITETTTKEPPLLKKE